MYCIYFQEGHDVLRTIIEFWILLATYVARIIRYLDLIKAYRIFFQPTTNQSSSKRSWKKKMSCLVTPRQVKIKGERFSLTSHKWQVTPDRFKIHLISTIRVTYWLTSHSLGIQSSSHPINILGDLEVTDLAHLFSLPFLRIILSDH